jgi:heme/copper-type cytochrome/quinol oxidase subunit 4
MKTTSRRVLSDEPYRERGIISSFFAVDLIVTAIVFWVHLYREAQRWLMANWWVYILATLLVGPSFALPLFLYFRESRIERLAFEAEG